MAGGSGRSFRPLEVDVINLGWDQHLAPLAPTTHGNSRAAVDGFKLCPRIAHADRSRHCLRAEPRLLRLAKMPTWREIRGAYARGRRALRQAMLEPLLVGWPVLRDVVMNALSARGHLVLCELGDVRFFVDPRDRVVGAWLMWHGGWQRREIDTAVEVLTAARRLAAGCGVCRCRRAYRHAHDLCAADRPLRTCHRVRARAAQCGITRQESRGERTARIRP